MLPLTHALKVESHTCDWQRSTSEPQTKISIAVPKTSQKIGDSIVQPVALGKAVFCEHIVNRLEQGKSNIPSAVCVRKISNKFDGKLVRQVLTPNNTLQKRLSNVWLFPSLFCVVIFREKRDCWLYQLALLKVGQGIPGSGEHMDPNCFSKTCIRMNQFAERLN